MPVTKDEYIQALKVIKLYAAQLRSEAPKSVHEIGCRVCLSEWGKEMQGKSKRKGTVLDFLPGFMNKTSDGVVFVKWDSIKEPDSMHISQVEKA